MLFEYNFLIKIVIIINYYLLLLYIFISFLY